MHPKVLARLTLPPFQVKTQLNVPVLNSLVVTSVRNSLGVFPSGAECGLSSLYSYFQSSTRILACSKLKNQPSFKHSFLYSRSDKAFQDCLFCAYHCKTAFEVNSVPLSLINSSIASYSFIKLYFLLKCCFCYPLSTGEFLV